MQHQQAPATAAANQRARSETLARRAAAPMRPLNEVVVVVCQEACLPL